MLVSELVEKLKALPQDLRVFVPDECYNCHEPEPRVSDVATLNGKTWIPLCTMGAANPNGEAVTL